MKKLNELYNVDSDVLINSIKINSKEVKENDIFVCTMGVNADRHLFIDEAIKNGASAIVVSKDVGKKSVPIIKVKDTNLELPKLAKKFYDYPNNKLKMIGITGTDGKTTTATIIQQLIGDEKCGYIGTNGAICHDKKLDNPNTTPDAHLFYSFLNEFVESGCIYASTEASSEAFYRGRLKYLEYDISVITNITSEHINIHKTFENYFECKMKLLEQTKKDGITILNKDDKYYEEMVKYVKSNKILTYGFKDADLIIKEYKLFADKTEIKFSYNNKIYNITSPLLGLFNIYNLAAALLVVDSLGISIDSILDNIKKLKVDGRCEVLDTKSNYKVIVDYAHTPNGIKNLLEFIKTLKHNRIITIIGQAGERDKTKRSKVGTVVANYSDYAIFTAEDPRSEKVIDICNDIIKNIKTNNYEIIEDRRKAIKKGINMAKEEDIVLILGKGNETYQKLKDKVIHFSDIEEANKAIKERL